MNFERFTEIAEEELLLLPDYVFKDLNGGIIADEKEYLHPAAQSNDLYIMGIYSRDRIMGKRIILYYGSFVRILHDADESVYRKRIRSTIRHEILHHLESQAGLYGKDTLVEEDRQRMIRYFTAHGKKPKV